MTATTTEKKIVGYACHGKGEKLVQWSYVPKHLGSDDIEIKISHCGICHSDIHTLDSGWGATSYPVIVGHEIVGTVVAVGAGVQR
jgi:alcohol dehydrogenase (NADP+)